MLKIRTARSTDVEAIHQVYRAAAGSELSLDDDHCERLLQAGGLVVAEEDGLILGFGGIDVDASEQLNWLYLMPEHQQAGTGSMILNRLEEIAWRAGLSSLHLHSAPDAVKFYLRRGYTEVSGVGNIHNHDGVEMLKQRPSNP